MCTVTYYKSENKTIVTSNRDEHISRPAALFPALHSYQNKAVYFPQDPLAQGTWFAVDTLGRTFVLLNGADKKHQHQPPYKRSRGLILLDLLSAEVLAEAWEQINLNKIEPFTLITIAGDELLQLRWDEKEKSLIQLDTAIPRIWSSATLYEEIAIENRKIWFKEFLESTPETIDSQGLLNFHTGTQIKDKVNGLIINRNQQLLTKNITQCVIEQDRFTLTHMDLLQNKQQQLIEMIQ
ncbi:MAG TPA: NRDE family protein [Bacteroidia bacterium]|nr:NRDE family protein [Bacteroidia bacterium]HRH09450.1 NRDE family protein [Bacteroidia bacterium]